MPIYDYRCRKCSTVFEKFAGLDDKMHECECGGVADRIIATTYSVHGDLEPYWDENIGDKPVYIKSKKHRRRVLEDAGLTEVIGKGWK